MKTLSIKQPWAYLIVHGKKNIENRTWKTNFCGTVLIHATQAPKSFTPEQCKLIQENMTEDEYNKACSQIREIVGSMDIEDCVQNDKSKWAEKGCWNWKISKVELFPEPIKNVKGKLGLWEYDF